MKCEQIGTISSKFGADWDNFIQKHPNLDEVRNVSINWKIWVNSTRLNQLWPNGNSSIQIWAKWNIFIQHWVSSNSFVQFWGISNSFISLSVIYKRSINFAYS